MANINVDVIKERLTLVFMNTFIVTAQSSRHEALFELLSLIPNIDFSEEENKELDKTLEGLLKMLEGVEGRFSGDRALHADQTKKLISIIGRG